MMKTLNVDRRQFIETGAIAAALAAAGRLPLLAADREGGSGIEPPDDPYAVKPIHDYLSRYSPAAGELRGRDRYALTYDIVHWGGGDWKTGKATNSVVGRLAIRRRTARDGHVVFGVRQQTKIGGVDNLIEANISCNPDEWTSLRDWTCRSYSTRPRGGNDPLSEIGETGRCNRGQIRIESGDQRYSHKATNPVVAQWTVPDLLIHHPKRARKATFDLLQDLSLFKPNQALSYDGETRVELRGGQNTTLQTYAQTGEGILPTHYLMDDQGRPQLITCSILSWALVGVA